MDRNVVLALDLTTECDVALDMAGALAHNDVAVALLDATGDGGLLCLETRARGPLSALVLGSTAGDVIRVLPVVGLTYG